MNEITEVIIRKGVHLLIDYLSITFPFVCYEDDFELKIIEEVVEMISSFLGFTKEQVSKDEYATNRYRYQYSLGENITLRLVGPELKSGYHSCFLELKGNGCREFENTNPDKTWSDLLEFFLIRINGRITRLDIAIDDYEGKEVNFDYIKNKLELKRYNSTFRNKYHKIMGCEEEGWSLLLGSYSSTQSLIIYDKLKEQQFRGTPSAQKYWLRFEMRYFQDKAYNVAMTMLKQGNENFRKFVLGLLYQMLDIKKENNYCAEAQHQVETDSRWRSFLEQVEKAKIEKHVVQSITNLNYKSWANPHAAFFFLSTLLECSLDHREAITRLYQNSLLVFKNMTSTKFKKLNQFQKESGLKKISELELKQLQEDIEKIIIERSTPF